MVAGISIGLLQVLAAVLVPVALLILNWLRSRVEDVEQTVDGELSEVNDRLDKLEDTKARRRETLFGGEDDPLSVGLTREVKNLKDDFETEVEVLKKRLEEIQDEQEALAEEADRIKERLNALESAVDD